MGFFKSVAVAQLWAAALLFVLLGDYADCFFLNARKHQRNV
jgi:hypothetical protein